MTPEERALKVKMCFTQTEYPVTVHALPDYPASFDAIVEAIRDAVAEERETLAKLIETMPVETYQSVPCGETVKHCRLQFAAAIRKGDALTIPEMVACFQKVD